MRKSMLYVLHNFVTWARREYPPQEAYSRPPQNKDFSNLYGLTAVPSGSLANNQL